MEALYVDGQIGRKAMLFLDDEAIEVRIVGIEHAPCMAVHVVDVREPGVEYFVPRSALRVLS